MTIALRAGDLELVLDPATGGAIAALTYGGVELLRPVADPRLAAQHGRAVAAYPLIPYANRIAWGRFALDGRHFEVAGNFGDHPHSIHGNGWMRAWTMAESAGQRARLTLDHRPPHDPASEWPFAFHAEQVFETRPGEVRITLSVENCDAHPWPAGLGLHPYVARTPETTLRFEADTRWTTDADSLPADRIPVAGAAEFAQARLLGWNEIDCCYAGWGGAAVVVLPECGLTLTLTAAPPLDHLQVYTPIGRDFMGLEPVSNMPDAINRMDEVADHGLQVLAPGERLAATVAILVRRTDD